jgi:RNA polymerase sigma factor (sigma-70 family)
MNDRRPTIFIVDDDTFVRDALQLMIEQENLDVQCYESGEAFLEHCPQTNNGCILLDVQMPGLNGLALQQILAERHMPLPIIFLTGNGNIPMSVKAIKAGAVDFLTKPVTRRTLIASIESALQENERIRQQTSLADDAGSLIAKLTVRERDVMQLAVGGMPNKEIARKLNISYRTVEVHKSRIMQKTGAGNLIELARIARESLLAGDQPR